jgi:hypothetical protein
MTTEKNEDIEINTINVNNILHSMLRSKSVSDDKIFKVPNFFYDIIRKKSHSFYNFKFFEIGRIVSIIWQYIVENLYLLKTTNQHKIKLAIYKIELILSSNQICSYLGKKEEIFTDNDNDNCILMAIFSMINNIKKIDNIIINQIDKN